MNRDLPSHAPAPSFWRSRPALGLVVIGTVAAYFLLTEHLAHVVGALPLLLLLSCPLMHVFMHHGHDHNRHNQSGHNHSHGNSDPKPYPGDTQRSHQAGPQ